MTETLEFVKMQGLGNDFIVVEGPASFTREEVARLCDRRFGVGADGILVVISGDPVRMEYWNADGSASEMCGNGLRCVARYARDKGMVDGGRFVIDTPVGTRHAVAHDEDDFEVELGPVRVGEQTRVGGVGFTPVDVGNPHAVHFVDDPFTADVAGVGASLQGEFADGVNVEFARVTDRGVTMRVWERGVGETMACGTGMAAVVAAAVGDDSGPVRVEVPGGVATVEIRGGVAWIRGPAEYAFRGSVAGR